MNSQQLIAKLKQYPLAVICTLVVLVMLVLVFLRMGNLPDLNAQYDALQDEAQVISRNSSNAVDLTANLEELSKLVEDVESRLIDADSVTANYRYFLGMGERSNVKYVNDPPAANYVKDAKMKSYAIAEFKNVAVQGTFEEVLNYLYELRTGEYLMRVDSISIAPKGGAGKQQVVASLNISGLAKLRPSKGKKK